MHHSQSMRFKLLTFIGALLTVVCIAFILFALIATKRQISSGNTEKSIAQSNTAKAILKELNDSVTKNALLIAGQSGSVLQSALKGSDSSGLSETALALLATTGCDTISLTDISGNTLLSVNSTADSKTLSGDEIYISGIAPVTDNAGNQIGTLTLRKRLDNDTTLIRFAEACGCDVAIYSQGALKNSHFNEASSYTPIDTLSAEITAKLEAGETAFEVLAVNGNQVITCYTPIFNNDQSLAGAVMTAPEFYQNSWLVIMWLIIFLAVQLVIYPVIAYYLKKFTAPIQRTSHEAERLATGDLDVEIEINRKDEIGVLQNAMHSLAETMRDQATVISHISAGNLTDSYTPKSAEDRMGNNIVKLLSNNNKMLSDIRTAADQVASGASQIAMAAQSLAEGSTEQAATIEQLSSTITEVGRQAGLTVEISQQASSDVESAASLIRQTVEYMEQMNETMRDIADRGQKISSVNKVIDDIAFQTNILALNAAVEAARAGQHGKGFAVVADEVRSLASKSAEAAQETASLIESNIAIVKKGAEIADMVTKSMENVHQITERTVHSIGTMNSASSQGSDALAALVNEIQQINQVVQANSATAEESASASEELNSQSSLLTDIVAKYSLKSY